MLNKLFCCHKWLSHAKRVKTQASIVPNTEFWYRPAFVDVTTEVLICEKCGKVKTIKY